MNATHTEQANKKACSFFMSKNGGITQHEKNNTAPGERAARTRRRITYGGFSMRIRRYAENTNKF